MSCHIDTLHQTILPLDRDPQKVIEDLQEPFERSD